MLKNACDTVADSESNFGTGAQGANAEAARHAACEAFMGGLLKNGEYAGARYFTQLARTYALRSLRDPNGTPMVRFHFQMLPLRTDLKTEPEFVGDL